MNLELFREKVRYYRPLTERTQEDLANALGLSPYVLSHKLHGTRNARLTHREVQAIVKTLVEWGAMTRQAEARELLELMDCPDFLPDEGSRPPRARAVFNRITRAAQTLSMQPLCNQAGQRGLSPVRAARRRSPPHLCAGTGGRPSTSARFTDERENWSS